MNITRKKVLIGGLLGAALYSIPLLTISGASDMFLKSDNDQGGLKGESVVPGFEGWIEIDSFQMGGGVAVSPFVGGQRETSQPSISEITFTKLMDSTSPAFFANMTKGQHLTRMRFHLGFVPESGRTFKFILDDVLVTGVSWSSGGGSGYESVSLAYKILTIQHYIADAKGGEILTGQVTYDLSTGATK